MRLRSEPDVAQDLVGRACEELAQHFDQVAIFVNSLGRDGVIVACADFKGNPFAVTGQVGAWIEWQKAQQNLAPAAPQGAGSFEERP